MKAGFDWGFGDGGFGDLRTGGYLGIGIGGLMVFGDGGGGGGVGREEKRFGFGRDAKIAIFDYR